MVVAILGASIELFLCLPAEPPNRRTAEPAELVPVCTVLWHSRCPTFALILS